MINIADKDIKFLPGVGPKRAELLGRELGITTYNDLLHFYPYKHIDRTRIHTIRGLDAQQSHVQLAGHIVRFRNEGNERRPRLVADFTDGTGTMELVWFAGAAWVMKQFRPGERYLVFGRPSDFGGRVSMAHPEIELWTGQADNQGLRYQPQYPSTEKLKNSFLGSKAILKLVENLFAEAKGQITESLPRWLIEKLRLPTSTEALYNIHFPPNDKALQAATFRIKFEELFFVQLTLLGQKIRAKNQLRGFVFEKVGRYFNDFYHNHLPFELTGAQKRVVRELRKDMRSGYQMNRLLQGDVGSGKTLVALLSMLIALDNGYQACLMAPTEILAGQHYQTFRKMLDGLDVRVELLTGSTKARMRKQIHQYLEDGQLHIIIGTHALLEDTVQFANLGLVVIDEQHRFGVAQRAKLWSKAEGRVPHVLVMTATPIPRTLAMTLYGDLDVSVIDELPPGRKPIQTAHYFDSKRLAMFGFLRKQIEAGRQVYVVYPLIKESENMDYKDLEDGYESIARAFPNLKIGVVHGRMKPEDKEMSMQYFKQGIYNIMVATTVIEVGVDVPNASVMVIESAERFGLSQLHQLRGRVGRGAEQSYCILMTSYKLSKEARQRLEVMVRTNDGFEIADADLKLRGPGDIEGTQQSGVAFGLRMANLAHDGQLVQLARDYAREVLDDDPLLENSDNQVLRYQLQHLKQSVTDWSRIS